MTEFEIMKAKFELASGMIRKAEDRISQLCNIVNQLAPRKVRQEDFLAGLPDARAILDEYINQNPPSHPAAAFIERMANFTTPEDEFAELHADEVAAAAEVGGEVMGYADVEEMIGDMSDDRLMDEYAVFMDMVREARTIRDAAPAPSRIVVTIRGGVAEVADAENWPADLELYLVDYDNDDGGSHLDGPCAVNKFCDDTPQADGMTGHFAKNVAEAWVND